ncbi:phosphate/phosphite/phosphonate ABC transporter substrate-binding protein [Bacillus sp. AK128]
MKKFVSLFMAMFLVLALAACGAGGNTEEEEAEGTTGEGAGEEEITELTMGFIPSQEADQIADNVKPLEEYLTEALGVPVKAEVMIDFVGLVEGMRTGQIDIGFTNPFGYVQAVDRANVEVLVKAMRHGSDTYKAQYIARADSGIESIEDIVASEGLTWAFGDTLSTSGYLFPASQLMEMGVTDLDAFFNQTAVGGHDNAVLAVFEGQADFATTFDDARTVIEKDHPAVMDEVVVVGHTDEIPNDGVSVRDGLSDEWKNKIKQAFLDINDNADVLAVMNEVYTWDGIAEATDAEYDIVREVYAKFKDQLEE